MACRWLADASLQGLVVEHDRVLMPPLTIGGEGKSQRRVTMRSGRFFGEADFACQPLGLGVVFFRRFVVEQRRYHVELRLRRVWFDLHRPSERCLPIFQL